MPRHRTATRPVIAIGLDSAPLELYRQWIGDGTLPVLARLSDTGAHAALRAPPVAVAETAWTTLYTGCTPERTGYWGPVPYDATGGVHWEATYDFKQFPPFYALGPDYRVAVVDLPQVPLVEGVSGIQVIGYGGHSTLTERGSLPAGLIDRLIQRYGEHPAYDRDFARAWRGGSMRRLYRRMRIGVGRRAAMVSDLLRGGDWDLFLTVFGEIHAGAHAFWHLHDDRHPWHALGVRRAGGDLLRAIAMDVDRALGQVVDAAGTDATIIIYTQQNSVPNGADLPTSAFLPEALFRWCLPGHAGLCGSPEPTNEAPQAAVTYPPSLGWTRDVWGRRADSSALRKALRTWLPVEVSRAVLHLIGDDPKGLRFPKMREVYIHPPIWYAPHWPRMKAFALPSFSDGFVRVNVAGRDPDGLVPPEDFAKVLDDVRAVVGSLRDARTGLPLVKDFLQVRTDPHAATGHPADLIVVWRDTPADVAESQLLGRIGPFPYRRTGGHDEKCFMIANGPAFTAGSTLSNGQTVDIAATILDVLGTSLPSNRDGRSLLRRATTASV